jgi:(4-alkanoyl-5-oxo-2,5-dihydrofuran-3-yl)methyl phosphate reductase
MILVTGANGTVGSEVVRQLLAIGESVRVLVRDRKKASGLGAEVSVVEADLAKPETLGAAFASIEKAFLVAAGPDLPNLDANAVDAARAARVKHIVKLSAQVVDAEPSIQIARWHRDGEARLKASGVPWTILRPAHFATNALHWIGSIRTQSAVFQPTGEGKMATIDPCDIAAVAVTVLTRPGHEGKEYALTGSEALSTAEQVRTIGAAIGRPLRFVDVPAEAARDKMLQAGMPEGMVIAVLELMGCVKAGHAATVTETVEQLLGRKPRRFDAWAARNAAAFT